MTPHEQSTLVFWMIVLLYAGVVVWVVLRRWAPYSAGLAIAIVAIIPAVGSRLFAGSDGVKFTFLLLAMVTAAFGRSLSAES